MPAIAAHYFFAMDVYDKLPYKIKNEIMLNFEEYRIGAQGPDIFFFYKPALLENPIRDYGHNVHHEQAFNLIRNALLSVEKFNSDIALGYTLGLVTHFALDSIFHQYINKVAYNFDYHMIIEKELDRFLIYKKTDIDPVQFKRYLLAEYHNDYYHQFLKLIYPTINPDVTYDAIQEMFKYQKMLYSPNGIKKEALKVVFRSKLPIPYDYSNMIIDIDDQMLFQSTIAKLDSIWDETVEIGARLIENCFNFIKEDEQLDEFFHRDFEGNDLSKKSAEK